MTGKTVIYGGSGGIGSALARRLHATGAEIHLAGRNEAALSELAQELGAGYTVGDVCDHEFFVRVSNDSGDVLGGLAYAVGTINLRGFQRLEVGDYLEDFRINVLGAALAVKHALPALKKSGQPASVVFFSSVAADTGFPFHASIGTSKAALNGLVVSLAAELAPRIRVNAVAPSLVRTPLSEKLLANEKTAEKMASMHPLDRLGEPDDIAAIAAHLLSEDAGWMTGQVVHVDGGRSTIASTE